VTFLWITRYSALFVTNLQKLFVFSVTSCIADDVDDDYDETAADVVDNVAIGNQIVSVSSSSSSF